ncbi:hypothetical protein LguiA_018628 [Lonicera macranthoides]
MLKLFRYRIKRSITMIDRREFLWVFSMISLVLYFLQGIKNAILMALTLNDTRYFLKRQTIESVELSRNDAVLEEKNEGKETGIFYPEENLGDVKLKGEEKLFEKKSVVNEVINNNNSNKTVSNSNKMRKRPAVRLVVPEYSPILEFLEMGKKMEKKEFEVEGNGFFLASKKGKRAVMEDGYGIVLDIFGDPKQAFFAVIDGHGGRAAADYVAENLGKNIVKELERVSKAENHLEAVMRGGYSVTDKEFLGQGVSGGACAAGVLLKDGELHVANVGDCRVVLCRKGSAFTLTNDHRLTREDERSRIENSGGYLHCRNGVWRVNGSLAVSRAIGDLHLKDWIISEPEIKKVPLTSDCEFLIMASDGLWDKVNDQEAVDVVVKGNNSVESCKKLVDISSSRGNVDDITVMVINLQKFVAD